MLKSIKKICVIIYLHIVALCKASKPEKSSAKKLIIILNGPSVREYLLKLMDNFENNDDTQYMCVNHFADKWEELFRKIKPKYYAVIDPFFATSEKWVAIFENVDWDMTLIVNSDGKHKQINNSRIHLHNVSPVEIIRRGRIPYLLHMNNFWSLSLMNVSCAAILEGVRRGFKSIEIYGLDLDFFMNYSVNMSNHLIQNFSGHSYKELKTDSVDLHSQYPKIVDAWHVQTCIFNSYYIIAEYAKKRKIKIFNMNPNSLVDAFEKKIS